VILRVNHLVNRLANLLRCRVESLHRNLAPLRQGTLLARQATSQLVNPPGSPPVNLVASHQGNQVVNQPLFLRQVHLVFLLGNPPVCLLDNLLGSPLLPLASRLINPQVSPRFSRLDSLLTSRAVVQPLLLDSPLESHPVSQP
jgi:hypothetical protein